MSRILFAWELGGNFGHLSRMLPVALALRARGHHVEFAIRELPRGEMVLRPHGFAMLQAPVWIGRGPPGPHAPTFAGILRRCGYHTLPALAGLAAAWRRLYALAQPDLVLLDHAPTASLAAQCDAVPCARLGSAWFAPPDSAPPAFVTSARGADQGLVDGCERGVLGLLNAVLRAAGRPTIERVTQLFRLEAEFLATFPELDHFGVRPQMRYYGPTEQPISATPPSWPEPAAGAAPQRIFAFLEAGYVGFDALLRALAGLRLPTLVYARDLPPHKARLASTPTLLVVATPLDLTRVVRESGLVICHGGHGTVTGTLLAGTPLLLLPRQAEQRMLADTVVAAGAGRLLLARKDKLPDYPAVIRHMLATPSYADASRALAARHAGHDPEIAAAAIADACERILASGGPARDTAIQGRPS